MGYNSVTSLITVFLLLLCLITLITMNTNVSMYCQESGIGNSNNQSHGNLPIVIAPHAMQMEMQRRQIQTQIANLSKDPVFQVEYINNDIKYNKNTIYIQCQYNTNTTRIQSKYTATTTINETSSKIHKV